jgi:hypothetical protein
MGSGRTQDQASGGFGKSDDTYGSSGRTGGDTYGSSTGAGGDSYGSSGRTGGDNYGSTTGGTSGGLGQDDTYGSSAQVPFPETVLLTLTRMLMALSLAGSAQLKMTTMAWDPAAQGKLSRRPLPLLYRVLTFIAQTTGDWRIRRHV